MSVRAVWVTVGHVEGGGDAVADAGAGVAVVVAGVAGSGSGGDDVVHGRKWLTRRKCLRESPRPAQAHVRCFRWYHCRVPFSPLSVSSSRGNAAAAVVGCGGVGVDVVDR